MVQNRIGARMQWTCIQWNLTVKLITGEVKEVAASLEVANFNIQQFQTIQLIQNITDKPPKN